MPTRGTNSFQNEKQQKGGKKKERKQKKGESKINCQGRQELCGEVAGPTSHYLDVENPERKKKSKKGRGKKEKKVSQRKTYVTAGKLRIKGQSIRPI